jgi:hypothetical protein
MLKISGSNIELTRGDTARINLSITDADGQPYDYSADTVLFTVKDSTVSSAAILQKTATGGVIYIAPADTEKMPYGDYVYDVELTMQSGDVCTVITPSRFTLTPEVTWS